MRLLIVLSLFFVISKESCSRRGELSLIRDSEIEDILKSYAEPLLKAAKLDPKAFRIFIVNTNDINAFVAGGQNLFLFTGLIQKTQKPEDLIGVMAHEIGHIAGGHLSRSEAEVERAQRTMLAGLIAGAAATAATGDMGGLFVGLGAGMGMAERNFLRFSRAQEASADQAALIFLERAGFSPQGLYDFFKVLNKQVGLSYTVQDPYLLSHPLSEERMRLVESACKSSPYAFKAMPEAIQKSHKRLVAKLNGYINSPSKTLQLYKENDQRPEARYARAIAFYRKIEIQKALSAIDALIKDYPEDPFFHELKGQILFENGKTPDALPCYKKALDLKPDSALIRISLAHMMLSLPNAPLHEVQQHLERASIQEPENPMVWELLAMTYGKMDEIGMAAYALAEKYMTYGALRDAMQQVLRAEKLIKNKPQITQKIQDIKAEIEYIRSKESLL